MAGVPRRYSPLDSGADLFRQPSSRRWQSWLCSRCPRAPRLRGLPRSVNRGIWRPSARICPPPSRPTASLDTIRRCNLSTSSHGLQSAGCTALCSGLDRKEAVLCLSARWTRGVWAPRLRRPGCDFRRRGGRRIPFACGAESGVGRRRSAIRIRGAGEHRVPCPACRFPSPCRAVRTSRVVPTTEPALAVETPTGRRLDQLAAPPWALLDHADQSCCQLERPGSASQALHPLDHHRHRFAAANAQRGHAVALAGALQVVQQGHQDARA